MGGLLFRNELGFLHDCVFLIFMRQKVKKRRERTMMKRRQCTHCSHVRVGVLERLW